MKRILISSAALIAVAVYAQTGEQHHRPPPPVIAVLDANRDHVIDAQEIANAAAALKSLDKNGDGQLTPNEFCPRPPRPHHDEEE